MARTGQRTRKTRAASARSSDYGQRLLHDALSISSSLLRSQIAVGAERLQGLAEATRD